MRILAIFTERNYKKTLRHFCHESGISYDILEPDEIEDIDTAADFDAVILCAYYPDDSVQLIAKQLFHKFPALANSKKLMIQNNESDILLEGFKSLSDYHIEQDLASSFSFNKPTSQKTLLFISDDRLLHVIIKDLFKGSTIKLLEANDGLKGYNVYKEHHPDLILTDLDMPGLNGFELLQKIKLDDADKNTNIVLYSSTSDESTIMKAYELHAKGYLIKPIKPDLLKSKLVKYMAN